jgi:uncharacterized protein YjbI with pentapeptide repeats
MGIFVDFKSRALMSAFRLGFAAVLLQTLISQQPLRAADACELTGAETYVLQTVQAGGACDLNTCGRDDTCRISAGFLAALLTRWTEVCPTHREFPRVVSITHAIIHSNIDLANLEVPFEVELTNCVFEDEVNFSKTVFRRSLHLSGSKFAARTAFSAMVIGRSDWSGSLYIDSATFNSDFDLTDASIQRNLFANNATFKCSETGPRFAKLTVNGDAHFEGAIFTGAPAFTQAQIKHGFLASKAQFTNRNTQAQFDDLIVGDDALFDQCRFAGPVDFNDARIRGDLKTTFAQFENVETGVSFRNLTVDGSALLSGAVFFGAADFTRATVGGSLTLSNAHFFLPSSAILFHELKVDGDAIFDGATFEGLADFHGSRIADELTLQNTHFKGLPASASFERLAVSGPANFTGANFLGAISFAQATFLTLNLEHVIWPTIRNDSWLTLDGLKYDSISAGNDEVSWRSLIDLLRHASYNANSYTALENYYQRIGNPDLADEVFFAQMHRERTDPLLHSSSGTKAWLLFLNVFVRYGRAPWMAFLWGLAIVLLGTLAFNEHRMEVQPKDGSEKMTKAHGQEVETQDAQTKAQGQEATQIANKAQEQRTPPEQHAQYTLSGYNAFWYSLDLFAPVIDLEAASAFRPKKKDHPVLYHYSRLHRILGWVLVPVGAAAVTGLTK